MARETFLHRGAPQGDPELAGKALQKDADAGKATLVGLLGLERARLDAISTAKARDKTDTAP